MRIGFDFDKVFVNYPPIIPDVMVDYLYKKHNHKLAYRIPGKVEQKVRLLSHHPLFRKPIKKNVVALKKISKHPHFELYLISSRFGFLEERTQKWVKKHGFDTIFRELHFNFTNEQPHLKKERMIQELGIKKFIDDDLELLRFLAKRNPSVDFYWISKKKIDEKLPANITHISDIDELYTKHLSHLKPVPIRIKRKISTKNIIPAATI